MTRAAREEEVVLLLEVCLLADKAPTVGGHHNWSLETQCHIQIHICISVNPREHVAGCAQTPNCLGGLELLRKSERRMLSSCVHGIV